MCQILAGVTSNQTKSRECGPFPSLSSHICQRAVHFPVFHWTVSVRVKHCGMLFTDNQVAVLCSALQESSQSSVMLAFSEELFHLVNNQSIYLLDQFFPGDQNLSRQMFYSDKIFSDRVVTVTRSVLRHTGSVQTPSDRLVCIFRQPTTSHVSIKVNASANRGTRHISSSMEQMGLNLSNSSSFYKGSSHSMQQTSLLLARSC